MNPLPQQQPPRPAKALKGVDRYICICIYVYMYVYRYRDIKDTDIYKDIDIQDMDIDVDIDLAVLKESGLALLQSSLGLI